MLRDYLVHLYFHNKYFLNFHLMNRTFSYYNHYTECYCVRMCYMAENSSNLFLESVLGYATDIPLTLINIKFMSSAKLYETCHYSTYILAGTSPTLSIILIYHGQEWFAIVDLNMHNPFFIFSAVNWLSFLFKTCSCL